MSETEPPGSEPVLPRVLVTSPEDEPTQHLVSFLRQQGFEVLWAREGGAAYDILDSEPVDALICHMSDSRIDGFRLVQLARQRNPEICAIVSGTADDIEQGTEVMRQGAYDFQVRPLNLGKLRAVLDRGLSHQKLVGEITDLQRRLQERYRYGGIARRSSAWQRIYAQIEQVAPSRATVLLTGETGTGKGEVAKAIHQNSTRRDRAFVETNCGALPDGIIESELFGHERGAFTGASTSHKGRFELADLGTLFLDEVGDLSSATQVKLLRVIQSGEFERVGGAETMRADVRLIAATNRDLEGMVEDGSYRADLFYRLNVVTIRIPPLRECREDVPILVNEFLGQFSQENDRTVHTITPAAMDLLMSYEWPGNVRELKNCVEGMVVMSPPERVLDVVDVPAPFRGEAPTPGDEDGMRVGMTMKQIEKLAIEETLKAVRHDRRKAAAMLEIGLSTLYRKEKEYGLR
ncbi:MAG TPA: sigma-54 dependent transcriptional regulator [Candidatus Latescibacteria bacterium]|nr:sigma-54 dependent transcriptional regulator [Candidatus Latescibacterota bacterium]